MFHFIRVLPIYIIYLPLTKTAGLGVMSEDLKWYSYSHFADGETETQ